MSSIFEYVADSDTTSTQSAETGRTEQAGRDDGGNGVAERLQSVDDKNEQLVNNIRNNNAYSDILKGYGTQQAEDYNAQEKRAKRQAAFALLGELAQIGGQAFALGRGARTFQPIRSQVTPALERLQKIRDARQAYGQEVEKMRLDAIIKDAERTNRLDLNLLNHGLQKADALQGRIYAVEDRDASINANNEERKAARTHEEKMLKEKAQIEKKRSPGVIKQKNDASPTYLYDNKNRVVYSAGSLNEQSLYSLIQAASPTEDEIEKHTSHKTGAYGNTEATVNWQDLLADLVFRGKIDRRILEKFGFTANLVGGSTGAKTNSGEGGVVEQTQAEFSSGQPVESRQRSQQEQWSVKDFLSK